MKKILATIIKEWILLRRDIGGLMMLLIMPGILIMVMAMVQDAPFKDYQQLKFELLFVDQDGGKLAETLPSLKVASMPAPKQRPSAPAPVIPLVHAPDDPGPDSPLDADPVPEPSQPRDAQGRFRLFR